MDLIVSKLRSTVSTTVSNINNILPGNPVTRDYEITGHKASGGPGLSWKIYSGFKKSTKEEASIFVLEKKILDKYSRRDKELVLDILRKGVSQLTKIRHPSILTVQHPLEESRDSLAFATEPVLASLANLYGQYDNIESPVPPEIRSYEFFEVEITYGLLQLSEGLAFLHSDAKLLHRNISPENVFVNRKGSWKLGGFDFAVQPIDPNEFPLKFPFLNITNNATDYPSLALPNLDYIAPEYITCISSGTSDPCLILGADMFSLGCLIYYIYNKGKPLLPTAGNINSMTTSRIDRFAKLPSETFNSIPNDLQRHISSLLYVDPTLRPDAHRFCKIELFDDVAVRTLQYLDSLFQFDNLERSKFYKGLPEIMTKMPKRIKLDRVFNCLVKEFLNSDMVPFVIPNVFLIAEELSSEEFVESMLPHLVQVLQMKEPIQIPMLLMENMELLLNKCKSHQDSIKSHILPMLCCCLENNSTEVPELCLKTLPTVAHLIDQNSMKNAIIPRIKKLFNNTNQLSTRVNSLICIAKLLQYLHKWLVLDDIIPFLTTITSKEPAIIMAIIGILKMVLNNSKLGLTKEIMATKVIPFLMPLSIENGLTTNQFIQILSLIREMVTLVEKEQKSKLEQLDNMRSQRDSALVKYTAKDSSTPSSILPLPSSSSHVSSKPETEFDFFAKLPMTSPSEEIKKTLPSTTTNVSSSSIKEPRAIEYPNQSLTSSSSESFQTLLAANISSNTSSISPQSKPKDLTSNLIDANIRNMSHNSMVNKNTTNSSNFMTNGTASTSAAIGLWSSSQPSTNINTYTNNPSNYSLQNASPALLQSRSPAFQNSYSTIAPSTSMISPNNLSRPTFNTSPLDKLTIPGLKHNNSGPSLNSMISHTPLIPLSSNLPTANENSGQGINKLSESDLKEFLS
ncbi:SCY1-like protein 2 [Tetranychus urticae]|uniref:Protein kinase domain-containing protein n=1 Tax=Tetranychus urticae TaxID=32264 RepID=T1L431_TETUR|nr:SCY1-like protein 2 [Tetranychus urticae]